MALALVDDVTGQAVTILSGDESRVVLAWMNAGLDAARRDQRNPALRFDPRARDVAEALTRTTVRQRMSATGHRSEAPTRAMSASGRAAAVVDPATDMIDVVQIAALLEITERQARRRAAQLGTKVGGRWLVSRSAIEGRHDR